MDSYGRNIKKIIAAANLCTRYSCYWSQRVWDALDAAAYRFFHTESQGGSGDHHLALLFSACWATELSIPWCRMGGCFKEQERNFLNPSSKDTLIHSCISLSNLVKETAWDSINIGFGKQKIWRRSRTVWKEKKIIKATWDKNKYSLRNALNYNQKY